MLLEVAVFLKDVHPKLEDDDHDVMLSFPLSASRS